MRESERQAIAEHVAKLVKNLRPICLLPTQYPSMRTGIAVAIATTVRASFFGHAKGVELVIPSPGATTAIAGAPINYAVND
jgi:hypothetical protein